MKFWLNVLSLFLYSSLAIAMPAAGVFLTTALWVSVAKAVVTSIVLSLISKALFKPKNQNGSMEGSVRERMVMVRSSIEPHRIVVGQALVSGPQAYIEVSGANSEYLHIIVLLAAHEVQEIGDLYFGDVLVGDLDGSGNVTTGVFAGFMRVKKHLGADNQTADSDLVAESAGKWTTDHRLQGIAYVYCRLLNNETAYPRGLEDIRALVKGKKFYDPRIVGSPNNPVWSPNPALATREYWAAATGLAAGSSEIDDTAIAVAANACDERVSVAYVTPAFTLDAGTELATFADDEPRLKTGDAVVPATTGSLAGSGLTAGTVYWWIRVSSTTGKFATSKADALAGTAINITGAGTPTHTLSPRAIVTASASTDKLTFETAERYIALGDGVQVAASVTLPTNLSALTTYYAIKTRDSEMQLALTYAHALAGNAIDLGSAGSGTISISHIDQARYTANGTYQLGETPEAIVSGLLSAMAGVRTFSQGQYKCFAGVYTTPTLTIDEDDLAGPITGSVGNDARELFNAVRGVYVDMFKYWQPSDFPAVTSSAYEADDNSEQIFADVDFPFATDVLRAQRLAKIHLERSRRAEPIVLPCKLTQFKAAVWDNAEVTIARLGYSAEVFRVSGWRFGWDENGPQVLLACVAEDANVYGWSASDATQIAQSQEQSLPDVRVVGAPVGVGSPLELGLTKERATQFPVVDPNVTVVIKVDWAAAVEANGKYYEVQWKKSADSTWQSHMLPFNGDTEFRIKETDDDDTYNVRVRTINTLGAKSAFISNTIVVVPDTVVADTDDIQIEAVTVPSSAFTLGSLLVSSAGAEIQRVSIDVSGGAPVNLHFSFHIEPQEPFPTSPYHNVTFFLDREDPGSPTETTQLISEEMTIAANIYNVGSPSGYISQGIVSFNYQDVPPAAGQYTYILTAILMVDGVGYASSVSSRSMIATEYKR